MDEGRGTVDGNIWEYKVSCTLKAGWGKVKNSSNLNTHYFKSLKMILRTELWQLFLKIASTSNIIGTQTSFFE